jgi:hypothetical protein
MKNITVAISEAQYRAARVCAAERDTSISSIVEHLLRNLPTVARAVSAMLAHELQAMGISPSKEAQALIGIIERPRQNQNLTRRFRGVNKCEPPQPSQSQEVNQPSQRRTGSQPMCNCEADARYLGGPPTLCSPMLLLTCHHREAVANLLNLRQKMRPPFHLDRLPAAQLKTLFLISE